jgi:hypothetical protein
MFSLLRPRRQHAKSRRANGIRPVLERLDQRINPTSPHFIFANSSISATGVLSVSFKEVGLGNNQNINYTITATVDATFGFVNNGGQVVMGNPFHVTSQTLASQTLSSDQNGNIVGTITGTALTSNLAQPNGNNWQPVISVSYTNVFLNDTTNHVSIQVSNQSINTFPDPRH